MSPRVVMTLLVRNEQDILGPNLAFHRAMGVDHFLVTDNRSEDETPTVLGEQPEDVTVWREQDDDYAQAVWVTRMARHAATDLGADWVINSDADEFWVPATGDLPSAFAALGPAVGTLVVERTDVVPRPATDAPFWESMTVRECASLNAHGAPLPPKAAHRASPDVVVEQGNHAVGGVPGETASGGVGIRHYPLRSYDQLARKIRFGGAAYARNTVLPPEIGSTWRMLHGLLLRGELRQWYDTKVLSDDALQAGLDDGSLVHDVGVRDVLRRL